MNQTAIPWVSPLTKDGKPDRAFSWNPVTGCTKVSAGCANCYAKRVADRFHMPFTVTLHPERLSEPLRTRKPAWVFLESMGDLFHPNVPDGFRDQVMAVIALTPQHHYWLLTKRAKEMEKYFSPADDLWGDRWPRAMNQICGECEPTVYPLKNLALGVTVESQDHMDRIKHLLATPAACRFVSHEPALGPLDLSGSFRDSDGWYCPTCDREVAPTAVTYEETHDVRCEGGCGDHVTEFPLKLDWVISGGESGAGARPAHPDWFRGVRDQCSWAGVPWFFKQWGEWLEQKQKSPALIPDNPEASRYLHMAWDGEQFEDMGYPIWCDYEDNWGSDCDFFGRVGTARAGHLLDGVEHHNWPNWATEER